MKSNLRTDNTVYRKAPSAMSRFSTLKGINSIAEWDKEHIFYNPFSLSKSGTTLKLTKFCEERKIFIFDQLLEEKIKAVRDQPVRKPLSRSVINMLLFSYQCVHKDFKIKIVPRDIVISRVPDYGQSIAHLCYIKVVQNYPRIFCRFPVPSEQTKRTIISCAVWLTEMSHPQHCAQC